MLSRLSSIYTQIVAGIKCWAVCRERQPLKPKRAKQIAADSPGPAVLQVGLVKAQPRPTKAAMGNYCLPYLGTLSFIEASAWHLQMSSFHISIVLDSGGFNGPPGALPSGPMGGMGGKGGGRGGPHSGFPTDNDRWLRSNPLPPVPQAPKLPQLHKTANRFEVRPFLAPAQALSPCTPVQAGSHPHTTADVHYTFFNDQLNCVDLCPATRFALLTDR